MTFYRINLWIKQTFPEVLTPRIIHVPTIIHATNKERAPYNCGVPKSSKL
jgi:hypothetical protein